MKDTIETFRNLLDTFEAEPYAFDTPEKFFVEMLAAVMDYHEQTHYMFRRDFDGMVALTKEARRKFREQGLKEAGGKS